MTEKAKDSLITIGKDTIRYILTLIFAGIGAYIGISEKMKDMQNGITNNTKDINRIEMNDLSWLKAKEEVHGNNLFYLQMNQTSLANYCNYTLPYKFENTRGM